MKKMIVFAGAMLAASALFAVTPVRVVPLDGSEVRVAQVIPPNLSTTSWQSNIVGQYNVTFQNVSSNEVWIGTHTAISSATASSFPLLNRGASISIDIGDNPVWYFWGNGLGDVRVLYFSK